MDQEIKKEFEELTLIIRDSFGDLESRMATKEDVASLDVRIGGIEARMATKEDVKSLNTRMDGVEKRMATKEDLQGGLKELRVQMDARFTSLDAELSEIKTKIRDLDGRVEKLFKVETEDVSAFYRDFAELKRRVEKIEKFVQLQAV